jgi:dUTPase
MEKKPRLRFALSREVQLPKRAGSNEAGIDFFVPTNLTVEDILKANKDVPDINIYQGNTDWPSAGTVCLHTNENGFVSEIWFGAGSRIIIPSGVHTLIEPWNSALIAANKSGVSTKKGLIFGAQVVDSTYTGEIHISELNPGEFPQVLKAGEKAIQFIHTPILLTRVEQIGWDGLDGFLENAKNWSERGSNWQGSTDNEQNEIEPYNEHLD